MNEFTKQFIWAQLGAAIDTLENCINTCPDEIWSDRTPRLEYWYACFHTLFWLDYYLTEDLSNFKPPEPFGMEEMDPDGVLPDRVYSKAELLTYLNFGRDKAHHIIESLSYEQATRPIELRRATISFAELLLYVMRHLQHHAAQLNLILREKANIAPSWVFQAKP